MNTFLFTCLYIHVHIYRHPWDVWSSLALNILSRPEWWTSSLYFFLFSFFLLKQLPLTEMALCCDCATTDLGYCLIDQIGSLESANKIWNDDDFHGIDQKFQFRWKCVSLKQGLFDLMSLCDINMKQHVRVLNWNK